MDNLRSSSLLSSAAPAYRLGVNPVDFERFARVAWTNDSHGIGPIPLELRQYVDEIDRDLDEIDEGVSDRSLRKDFRAAALYAWKDFETAWDSPAHRDAIEYQGYDWGYIEQSPDDAIIFREAPFGRGAWADLHRAAERYRLALPEPLFLCASLGANVSAVRWIHSFPSGDSPPPGVTSLPVRRVGELLTRVAEHLPVLAGIAAEFADEMERQTNGFATVPDIEWALARCKEIHVQISRGLDRDRTVRRIFEAPRARLTKALGKSVGYSHYLERLEKLGKIAILSKKSWHFRIEILDDSLIEKYGDNLSAL